MKHDTLNDKMVIYGNDKLWNDEIEANSDSSSDEYESNSDNEAVGEISNEEMEESNSSADTECHKSDSDAKGTTCNDDMERNSFNDDEEGSDYSEGNINKGYCKRENDLFVNCKAKKLQVDEYSTDKSKDDIEDSDNSEKEEYEWLDFDEEEIKKESVTDWDELYGGESSDSRSLL